MKICGIANYNEPLREWGFALMGLGVAMGLFFAAPAFGAQVEQAWSAKQPGSEAGALTTDEAGNVYVATYAYSERDIVLTKYDAGGAKLWQTQYTNAPTMNFAAAVAVTGTNVVVVGQVYNTNGHGDWDFITLKYNTSGSLLWAAQYNGPAGLSDYGVAASVDSDGNVLVAGNSPGVNSAMDMVLAKYDATGNQLWVFRYDGPGQNHDLVRGLKVDAQGNSYLAGSSYDVANRTAITTLKINPGGQQLWAAQFLSASDRIQANARGLALDGAGNVITVGEEGGEFITLKYAPDGGLLWTARYRAEEPAGMVATDVRVDAANNIVTGGNLFGSGTNDAVLVKYGPAGHQLWASRISYPPHPFHLYALDMDADGNTYLTGAPHIDALTVKVGADGNQIWSANYDSDGTSYDIGEYLKCDSLGNVIIAGRSTYFGQTFVSVVKYRQNAIAGAPVVTVSPTNQIVNMGTNVTFTAAATGNGPLYYQWRFTGRPIPGATSSSLTLSNVQVVHRGDYSVIVANTIATTVSPEVRLTVLEMPTVTVQPDNQIALTGTDVGFIATAQGTPPLTFQWRQGGTNISGATNDVLRLAGLTSSNAGGYSVVVVNPAGSVTSSVVSLMVSNSVGQNPVARFDGSGRGTDENPLLHVTAAGECVVVASSAGTGTGNDIAVLKYSADGNLLWASSFNRGGTDEDIPADLAVDLTGNIYVTGFSGEYWNANRVFTTLKYAPDGRLLWARHFRETNTADSVATSIAVGPGGSVTVAGRAETIAIVIRYDAAGNELWTSRGSNSWYDANQAVAVDAAGNSYFGTSVILTNSETDFFLRKLDPSGGVVWTRTFDAGLSDELTGLALDHMENIVGAGTSVVDPSHAHDAVVFKYTADGVRLWVTNVDSVPVQNDFTRNLVLDEAGQIFVVASVEDYDDDPLGAAIIKIDSDGHVLWTSVEEDLQVGRMNRMAVDASGNAFVTGLAYRPATDADIATIKYDSNGQRVWAGYYAGPGTSYDFGTAVAVDGLGNIRVAGHGTAYVGIGTDLVLLNYQELAPGGEFHVRAIRMNNGLFRLEVPSGTSYAVEVSTNLVNWTRVEDAEELNRLLNSGIPMPAPVSQRFYRLAVRGALAE